METIGVIPARLESQRLSHKLLRKILGKPLIQWTWESAKKAHLLDKLIVACDSVQIERIVKDFGGEVVLTSSGHRSGSDRIAEVVGDIDARVIVNIQADEPLIHPSIIDSLVSCMSDDYDLVMATVKKKIDDIEEINDVNIVKVVTDKDNFALYFSRLPIPFYRDKDKESIYYKHLGIYAYTKDFLYTFKNLPYSFLEEAERLEQLRALEAGIKIKVIETNFDSWGVDTEEDLRKVERILSQKGYA